MSIFNSFSLHGHWKTPWDTYDLISTYSLVHNPTPEYIFHKDMNEKQKNLLVLCLCLCTITDHIYCVLIIFRILIFIEIIWIVWKSAYIWNTTLFYMGSVKVLKLGESSNIDKHVLYTRHIRYYNFLVGQTLA